MPLFTLGHSTRSLPAFLHLLKTYGIETLVDIRSFPSSKRFPHFNGEALAKTLPAQGIEYVWLGRELGGYRKKGLGQASPNKAWGSPGFRNYADHMLTEDFQRGVSKVLRLAQEKNVALMCAERLWWRCHRRLLSDWLVAHGHRVVHIVDLGETVEHRLSPFARVADGRVIYPREELWNHGCGKASCRKSFRAGKRGA